MRPYGSDGRHASAWTTIRLPSPAGSPLAPGRVAGSLCRRPLLAGEGPAEQLVDPLRVGPPAGPLHDLADEPAEGGRLSCPVARRLLREGRHHFGDDRFERGVVRELGQALALD